MNTPPQSVQRKSLSDQWVVRPDIDQYYHVPGSCPGAPKKSKKPVVTTGQDYDRYSDLVNHK